MYLNVFSFDDLIKFILVVNVSAEYCLKLNTTSRYKYFGNVNLAGLKITK